MSVTFQPLQDTERDLLADWVSSDEWPFHVGTRRTREDVLSVFDKRFMNDEVRSFWMLDGDERVGFFVIMDLEDETPMLDLRLRTEYRGCGYGKIALKWLTDHIFTTWPDKIRIEGQTREDNLAMRRVFRQCGYVKEAHYRASWPTPEGGRVASIGYGILRSDWEQGVTTPLTWDDEVNSAWPS